MPKLTANTALFVAASTLGGAVAATDATDDADASAAILADRTLAAEAIDCATILACRSADAEETDATDAADAERALAEEAAAYHIESVYVLIRVY